MRIKHKKRIEEADFVRAIDKFSRVENCVLCGKKISSACNSHVVPQFILKQIAENGRVSYGHGLHKREIGGLERTTGIKNAYPFRLICNDCDRELFKNYENPDNLYRYDELDINTQKKILCEMAIKAHLSHINMKFRTMVMQDMITGGKLGMMEQEGKAVFFQRIDIIEHERYVRKLRKTIKTNKNPFVMVFDKVLDYKTKIATQTIINYNFDLNGEMVFDPTLMLNDNESRYFYLMILPLIDKTRILFYIEKEHFHNVENIVEQFNDLTEEEKIHFLFISLIIHDQQFYMSPSLMEYIRKNDKKLIKLYTKTNEIEIKNQAMIKDFRSEERRVGKECRC